LIVLLGQLIKERFEHCTVAIHGGRSLPTGPDDSR
jgi:hypothetical protein